MEFNENLKAARETAGLTQLQIADRMGITKSTYCGYETGKRKPDVMKIKQLAHILGVTGSYLIGVDELPDIDASDCSKKASPYSGEALKLAKDYDGLDKWGKQAVRDVADTEMARMEDESRFFQNTDAEQEPKVINLFLEPAAAGIATPLVGQDYEPYELKPGDPLGAAFAIRIQGDSMEPYFPDGSTAFVNRDALVDGDIGVFCVDSGTVCKQYHYDRVLGITYLFSLNRKRADCDVVITRDSNQSLVCQGRIMTKKRFPLPEL